MFNFRVFLKTVFFLLCSFNLDFILTLFIFTSQSNFADLYVLMLIAICNVDTERE